MRDLVSRHKAENNHQVRHLKVDPWSANAHSCKHTHIHMYTHLCAHAHTHTYSQKKGLPFQLHKDESAQGQLPIPLDCQVSSAWAARFQWLGKPGKWGYEHPASNSSDVRLASDHHSRWAWGSASPDQSLTSPCWTRLLSSLPQDLGTTHFTHRAISTGFWKIHPYYCILSMLLIMDLEESHSLLLFSSYRTPKRNLWIDQLDK